MLLTQLRDTMDNQVSDIKRLSTELMWNPRIQELFYSSKYVRKDYLYDLYKATQDLFVNQSTYPSISDFYIYWNTAQTAILPKRYLEGDGVYDDFYGNADFSVSEWQALVRRTDLRDFITIGQTGKDNRRKAYLTFFNSYPVSSDGQPVATNVIMVDAAKVLNLLERTQLFRDGTIMILDKSNNVLMSSADKPDLSFTANGEFAADSLYFHGTYNGEDSLFFSARSTNSDLRYVSVIPTRVIFKRMITTRNTTVLGLTFSLMAGLVLVWLFIRRNYSPIRSLIGSLRVEPNAAAAKETNEYRLIQGVISHTLSEQEKMNFRLQQQNTMLRSNFLGKLLRGKLDEQPALDDALASYGMSFSGDQFAVILFYLEDYAAYFASLGDMREGDKEKLLALVVFNVTEELANRNSRSYMTETGDMFACLVNVGGDDREKGAMRRIAEEARSFLRKHYQIEMTVSVSRIHSTVLGIAQAYREALDAMEYKMITGDGSVIAFEDIRAASGQMPHASFYYPVQVEQTLINYVKIGEYEKAKITLDEVIARNIGAPAVSVPLAKCLMFNVINTMIRAVSELGGMDHERLSTNAVAVESLLHCQTIPEMQTSINRFLQEVCDFTNEKKRLQQQTVRQQQLHKLSEDIKTFVERRYDDPNMNITMVGEHFRMKYTYLSKLFKDETGIGLLDYMNRVRIDKAKEHLLREGVAVHEAASRVGYNDVNVFIRAFKKQTGLTPGQFKEADRG
ncbi:helix-turn-helix domain-containing protein [Paenibacillus cymbidii]|uniref:helix-turn-helix domain-containing protein n=1 Tax=Paenibacillus cymbidii TaxID=1639034 RepID=UPI0010821768|nr:helix-turn-helix domain-containing protein [Paenibacillus cymbidii]